MVRAMRHQFALPYVALLVAARVSIDPASQRHRLSHDMVAKPLAHPTFADHIHFDTQQILQVDQEAAMIK